MRSHGGWAEVRKHGLKGQSSIKNDERILRESDFVADVLFQSNEAFDRKYDLKHLGYYLDRVAAIGAELDLGISFIFCRHFGKQKREQSLSFYFFW